MLYLSLYHAEIRQSDIEKVHGLQARFAERFRALLRPALEFAAQVLGVPPGRLRRLPISGRDPFEPSRVALDGEVFADGTNLIVVHLHQHETQQQVGPAHGRLANAAGDENTYEFHISFIGPVAEPASLNWAITTAEAALDVKLEAFRYASQRPGASNAAEGEAEPSKAEQWGTCLLQDRSLRTLAMAIQSSGGLLVRDVPRHLRPEDRGRCGELIEELRNAGLIDSEIVIICARSGAQVMRAPNREVVAELSAKGLKCACGRPLADERMEEALAIMDLGRALLDRSRWLTVLLIEELRRLGVPRECIIVEQAGEGDETDANASAERSPFGLKEKRFDLENVNALEVRIEVARLKRRLIVTSERLENDANDHIVRARLTGPAGEEDTLALGDREEITREIGSIDGVAQLRSVLEELVIAMNRSDAARILDEILPLASLAGSGLVRAIEEAAEHPRPDRPLSPTHAVEGPASTPFAST